MSKYERETIVFIVISAFLYLFCPPNVPTCSASIDLPSIRVVTDDNYPPFVIKEEDGTLKGILVDQWRLWEKKTGTNVTLYAMDWNEAQQRMLEGEFDVIDTLFSNETRQQLYDFSKPYTQIDVPIFFRSDLSGIHDENDLKGFAVGVKAGDSSIDFLKSKGVTNLIEFNNYESIVSAARDGKVNVFVVDKPPSLYFLYKMDIQDKFSSSSPLYSGEFHRAVLKGRIDILEKVESGFGQISRDEYEEIEKRWYGEPILTKKWMRYVLIGVVLTASILAFMFFWLWMLRRIVVQKTADLAKEIEYRIRQEKMLKDSNDRFESIFNVTNEAIFIHELPSLKIIDVNQTMCQMFGYPYDEALNLSLADLSSNVSPYSQTEAEDWLKKAMNGEPQQFQWHAKQKSGNLFWVENKLKLATIGSVERIIVTVRDITDSNKVNDKLRESEKRFRLITENISEVFWIADYKINTLLYISPGYERIWGRSVESLYNNPKSFIETIHVDDHDKIYSALVTGKNLLPFDHEYRVVRPDGEIRWIWDRGFPVQEEIVNYYVGIAQDITERKKAEDVRLKLESQLQQAQKMKGIGLLAGGIAHDLNNMLFPICCLSEMLLDSIPPENSLHGTIKQIYHSATRGSDLVRQILSFSRQAEAHKFPIKIQTILTEVLKLIRATIPQQITITYQIENDCGSITADPTHIHQIAMNLITNAYHAVEENGGTILVDLKEVRIENENAPIHGMKSGRYACFSVHDTGVGIDEAVLEMIFSPYFTTKGIGKGTGLGLSVVHGIVKEYGGDIEVHSERGNIE